MRRFSSEGSLLEIDFLPWRRVLQGNPDYQSYRGSGTYTPRTEEHRQDGRSAGPTILEPRKSPGDGGRKELSRERSISVESFCDLGKGDKNSLGVCVISESYRTYSDSQLAAAAQGSTERDEQPPSTLTSSSKPFHFKNMHLQHPKPKFPSVKLQFRTLFGQRHHSSNPNLFIPDEKDSATERRSPLHFMRQVSHSRKRRISREELEKWAESLNALLGNQTAVSVFGSFLRSEFSEENLQFYLACEQYKHSSNNFSLHRRAKDICATYIQPGASREVNLDSKTRDLTIQLLQAPSHGSLSHAQKRVYSLLDTDCYPRFLQSNIYLSLLQEAD